MTQCDFHYSHLLPKKPGILPLEETMTKECPLRRCIYHALTHPQTLRCLSDGGLRREAEESQ